MLWLILGLLIGIGGWWLVSWTRKRQFGVKWYSWLLLALAVVLALLAIQNYTAFIQEMEPGAAGVMLALLGVPALFLAIIAVALTWLRGRKATAKA